MLWAADGAGDRVLAFGFAGETLAVIGDDGLRSPAGVAVGPGGDVFVADDDAVVRFAPTGAPLVAWPADRPAGLAAAGDGTVWVAERDAVRRYAADGTALAGWAADRPRGIAVAPDGSLWVALDDRVVHSAASGETLGAFAAADPRGVAVRADGIVLVAERHDDHVAMLSAAGVRLGAIGGGIRSPEGVAVDCRGNVAVSDDGGRIERLAAPSGLRPPCQVVAGDSASPLPVARRLDVRPVERRRVAVAGEIAIAEPLGRGRVLVRGPREDRASVLARARRVPMGTYVDARDGRVRVRFGTRTADFDRLGTAQSGTFSGGAFTIGQGDVRARVNVRLAGPSSGCGGAALTARVRGRFRIAGRHAAITARNARVVMQESCGATTVSVRRGVVTVRDGGRAVRVRAGSSYVAPAG